MMWVIQCVHRICHLERKLARMKKACDDLIKTKKDAKPSAKKSDAYDRLVRHIISMRKGI